MDMAEVDERKRERELAEREGRLEAQTGVGMVNVDGKPVMPKAYTAPVTPY